jgi:hypothetical protein
MFCAYANTCIDDLIFDVVDFRFNDKMTKQVLGSFERDFSDSAENATISYYLYKEDLP